MHIRAECLACMVTQIEKAIVLLRPEVPNDEIVSIQKHIMAKMALITEDQTPYYGQLLYRSIAEELGDPDPYAALKVKYNELALELVPKLEDILKNAENPLLTALTIAILGNCVDFGTPHQINLEEEVKNFSSDNLRVNHYEDFKIDFQKARKVLIIGDNTGEIVLDKVMLEFFLQNYPEKEFIYAVRGGPAINDATIKDAEMLGITKLLKVVEGSKCPGVILDETTPEFKEAFNSADMIISKGQGNFESLDNIPAPKAEVYFLLKAKCNLVAGMFGIPLGSLVLYHRKSINDFV